MDASRLVLSIGSVVFLVGAFLPVSRIYTRPPEDQLAIIRAHMREWYAHLLGMGAGSVIAAAGLVILAGRIDVSTALRGVALLGALGAIVGTALWCWHLWLRVIDLEGFTRGGARRPFYAYTVLMHLALLAFGIAILFGEGPQWLGVVVVGGVIAMGAAAAVFRDMPPLVYYAFGVLIGIAIAV